jgi:peptidoglycan/xylan/chitin deacetylase (PgdA/CDA1 family)
MRFIFNLLIFSLFFSLLLWILPGEGEALEGKESPGGIPILVYHRFGPAAVDSMTVRTSVFDAHLKFLQDNGYRVLPLRELLDGRINIKNDPSSNSHLVAITADDAHVSIYTEALPLVKKYRIPVTLFIYPSAVSNASYAMTWAQLRELKDTGLFDLQSHTYWHPNFKKDRERLKPAEFEKSVETQMKKSKETLEKQFNRKVDMLAWPFGIHDAWLMDKAAEAGYGAAFTIERHPACPSDHRMALPRYLMTDADRGKAFERIVGTNSNGR